jgi:tetratricopeptide (TPR) repeat protein
MPSRWSPDILVRLLLPLVLIPLLGISPRQHATDWSMAWARHSMDSGNLDGAVFQLARLVDRFPWRLDLLELAGEFALRAGDPQAALDFYARLEARGNLAPVSWMLRGDAAHQAEDIQAALRFWNASLVRGGPPLELTARLAETYHQLGDYPSLLSALRALEGFTPDDPQTQYRLGLLLAALEPGSASDHLSRAAELDPSLAQAAYFIRQKIRTAAWEDDPLYQQMEAGRAMASVGEWEYAALAFEQVAQARPDYADAWAFLGESRQQLGGDGYLQLIRALELESDSIAGNTFSALYWQRQSRHDLALVFLHTAAAVEPTNPALQAEIGNTLANLGVLAKAEAYYHRAVELAPRDLTYLHLLANFSIRYGVRLRELALPAARQAVLLRPDDPASLDLMGHIYLLLDDPISARRFLLRALQADSGFPPARLHLGFLYLMEGDRQAAREELHLALSLAQPGSPVAIQADRLISSNFP